MKSFFGDTWRTVIMHAIYWAVGYGLLPFWFAWYVLEFLYKPKPPPEAPEVIIYHVVTGKIDELMACHGNAKVAARIALGRVTDRKPHGYFDMGMLGEYVTVTNKNGTEKFCILEILDNLGIGKSVKGELVWRFDVPVLK